MASVDAKLLKSTKFPPEFNQKVDMRKVNVEVIKTWIANRINEVLGTHDDVVIDYTFELIEGARSPDIKAMQIQLTGFLEKETPKFCKDLWKLLLSAQASPQGVPKELLEAKKLELMQEKADADRAGEDTRRRRDEEDRREREISQMKERDRQGRGAFQNQRGGRRGDRGFDRGGRGGGRGRDRPRSPDDRFRPSRDPYGRDSYVPRGRGRDGDRGRGQGRGGRRRSPSITPSASSRSRSRSRSDSRSSDRSGRGRYSRKRSRSRSRSRSGGRDRRRGSRRSRSRGSESRSPTPKRRRYSSSRSRSPSPRRRRRYSSSSRSSRSYSRSRSDSRDRSSSRSRSRSRGPTRRCSVSSRRSDSRGRGGSGRDRRGSGGRRRNSSSPSRSPSPARRGKSADPSEDDRPSTTRKPDPETATDDRETQAPTNQPRASVLKEKLLRDKIMKMRSSASGANSGGQAN